MDTIFAESTPPGRGGVSIIRLSGPAARKAAEALAGPLPLARRAEFRTLRDGSEVLDQALVMRFDAGASFTGEEVVELQLHGAPVIVRRIEKALASQGLRNAEAGEFTRRAFLNGRIDLAEAEGLADLLDAETEAQRRLAMTVATGGIGARVGAWREMLIRAGALVEVSVDFADEEVPEDIPAEVFDLLSQLRLEFDGEIGGFAAAERCRIGFEVAVIGPPNAGKSSLINRIARRDIAIVSEIAGTTRDVIELRIDLRGLAVTFLDTAGLRETLDPIESIGVDRARGRAEAADLRLHLSDGDVTTEPGLWCLGDIAVRTKADLQNHGGVSAVSGAGVDALLEKIYTELSSRVSGAGVISHQRQLIALTDARDALNDVDGLPAELLAESIRQAATALDRLVGKIGAEDYLDVIFSSFCIGK